MKKLILPILTLIAVNFVYSQEVWEPLPPNPNITSPIYDIEMVDGRVFQIYYQNSGADEVIVDFYSPKTLSWQNLTVIPSPVITRLKTEQINGAIMIAFYDNANNFNFYKLDQGGTTLNTISSPLNAPGANNNWEFHSGKNDNELYVLYTTGTGPSDVHGLEYDGAGAWTPTSESSGSDLSNATLRIQSSTTDVYFGVYSGKIRMTRFVKGAIGTMFAYDGGPNGEILVSGSPWNNNGFAITGNKTDLPFFFGTEDANNKSYEALVDGTTIDIGLTQPSVGFSVDTFNMAIESSPSHSFIFSNFGNEGIGAPHERVEVIRRDMTIPSDPWTTLTVTPMLPLATALEPNSLHLGINNSYNHIAASYTKLGAGSNEIQVSNQQPYHLTGSMDANSGLCPNKMNEIYGSIQLMDENYDNIKILSATSVNATTSGITVIPDGFDSGVSKFKIFGVPTSATDQISIQYTDGYNTYTSILNAFTANTNPVNLQFLSNPVLFCSNEKQIDLSQTVNYYDGGFFRLNGQEMSSSLVDATSLAVGNGTLRYTVAVNGCFVTTTANYNVVTAPSLSVTANPTSCGTSSGNATAVLTAGSSANTFMYWSTGEQTTTIANLAPGAYYVHVNDDNGCHATALASVEASDITITETIVNPTCSDSKNGSINLVVTGSTDNQIVWSNGTFGELADKLKAGMYEFTLYDASGCEVKKSYVLTSPPALSNSIAVSQPDCGVSNGSLLCTVNGGTSPYQFAWSNGGTIPNLTGLGQGYYTLLVTDDVGCTLKDSLYLNEKLGVEISDSVILANCFVNNGGIDLTLTVPTLGDPVSSIQWDNGLTTEDIYNLSAGNYMVSVLTTSNCLSQKTITVGVKSPLLNEICVVTVDDSTTTNLVVWEKAETSGISYYNIYRENADAGNYNWIDTVQFGSLSVFNDVIASPLQRSWRYRISAVNECGVEGPISAPHKTLHLNTINQLTPGIVDIYWDDYEGTTAAEYVVNRFTDQNGWEVLAPSVPFGNPTVFTDTPPVGSTNLDYYVSLNLNDPCTATYKAQDFNSSRSNKEKGVFSPGNGTGDSNNEVLSLSMENVFLTVSPNPFSEVLHIKLLGTAKTNIEIRDIHGKLISTSICKEGESSIPTDTFSPGIYFISAMLNGTQRTLKIVK